MRFLLIPISAVILFFPAFWLFSWVVGTDWGAGIAAFFMYLWYPYFAFKYFERNDPKRKNDMYSALERGELEVSEYEVSEYIVVEESEDEGLYYLFNIGNNTTLCLSGQYLYEASASANFPSSKIRVFWNKADGFTYGAEGIGHKLLPVKQVPTFTVRQWSSDILPTDRDVVDSSLEHLCNEIRKMA